MSPKLAANPDLHICQRCVGDSVLRAEVRKQGTLGGCNYCHWRRRVVPISWVGERMTQVLRDLYELSATQPDPLEALLNAARGTEWHPQGDPMDSIIMDEAGVKERVAKDIEAAIHRDTHDRDTRESEFGTEPYFVPRRSTPEHLVAAWDALVRSLQEESRTLTRASRRTLRATFDNIDKQAVVHNNAAVLNIGPGTSVERLFRARVFQQKERLLDALKNPTQELAPPPNGMASAGRMNFAGIAVFYGATTRRTAIDEVRPPVGSYVLTGAFRFKRTLRVLDIGALSKAYSSGSSFSPDAVEQRDKAAFLSELCDRMVDPVVPDHQAQNYLPTQVVAEYLASHPQLRLDGLKYPSVQGTEKSACNVVLFHKASRVSTKNAKRVTGVNLFDEDEDGEHLAPSVLVAPKAAAPSVADATTPDDSVPRRDRRKVTLRLNHRSLKVHDVKKVRCLYDSASVGFHEKLGPDDLPPDF
jgi:hypothetical protein